MDTTIASLISSGQERLTTSRITNNGIWQVYKVEDLLTGQSQIFRRLHTKDLDASVGDGRELFEHRVAVENDMKENLSQSLRKYHVVLHTAAWRAPDMDMAYMTEPFLEDAFELTDDRFVKLAEKDPEEAERLIDQAVYLFRELYKHGVVHGDAHTGNVLVVPNGSDIPRHLRKHRIVLIDFDWAHSERVPFTRVQLERLRDICAEDTPEDFEEAPCDEAEDTDFFCTYRAASLASSGDPDGRPLPFVDLSVFAYMLYFEYLCTDLANKAPPRLLSYIERLYRIAYKSDFDVTRLFKTST